MKHFASPTFWDAYQKLPAHVRELADKNLAILKHDTRHPSLHFKKVGGYWSVRVGTRYRALGVRVDEAIVWFWIGSHSDYDALIR